MLLCQRKLYVNCGQKHRSLLNISNRVFQVKEEKDHPDCFWMCANRERVAFAPLKTSLHEERGKNDT